MYGMKWYKLLTAMMILVGPKQEIYCDFWFLSLSESYCRRIRRTIFLEVHISQTQLSIIKKYWKPHYKLFSMYITGPYCQCNHTILSQLYLWPLVLSSWLKRLQVYSHCPIQQYNNKNWDWNWIHFLHI